MVFSTTTTFPVYKDQSFNCTNQIWKFSVHNYNLIIKTMQLKAIAKCWNLELEKNVKANLPTIYGNHILPLITPLTELFGEWLNLQPIQWAMMGIEPTDKLPSIALILINYGGIKL